MVWIEIIKPIYHFEVGHIQEWCDRKAAVVIASGHGKKVSKPKPEKKLDKKPEKKVEKKVEVAIITPEVETADISPVEKKTYSFSKKEKKD